MNTITQGNLSGVLEKIWQDPQAKICHLLVLTYKFDAQQFLNLACSKPPEDDFLPSYRELSQLSLLRPLVICDATAIGEHSGLPPFMEIHPWNQPGFGCHHSKAYCIITDTSVHLVLGSFNLTRDGLFHNREVLDHFCWTENEGAHPDLLQEWTSFVRGVYLSRLRDSTASALLAVVEELERRCKKLSTATEAAQEECALLTSGYAQSGLDALENLWRRWYGEEQPHSVLAVSPFFDTQPVKGCVADELSKRFPGLCALTIVTDETEQPALCQRHFGALNGAYYRIPASLEVAETQEIQRRAAERHAAIIDQVITRKLHAKILVLTGHQGGLVYLGSANFTRNAWLGKNCELGVAWRCGADATPQADILAHLHGEQKNRHAELPKERPLRAGMDDEPALWHDLYPRGIAHVVLRADAEVQQARFQIMPHVEYPLHLENYSIRWGHTLLNFIEHHSQWLPPDIWKPLLLQARYLEFRPHHQPDPIKPLIFWLPFAFAGAIVAQGEALVFQNSLDWLLLHQSDASVPGYGDLGFNEGETPPALWDDALDSINRTQNRVIAMQHTLTLFARVEERYRRLVRKALECPTEEARLHQLTHSVRPLDAYTSLLHQELLQQPTDAAFKMGELALFLRGLAGELREQGEHTLAATCLFSLLHRLDVLLADIPAEEEALRQHYLIFVRRQLALLWEDS